MIFILIKILIMMLKIIKMKMKILLIINNMIACKFRRRFYINYITTRTREY